jgi:hypothetical protein
MYFSPEAAARARKQLVDALAPGGILVLGVGDIAVDGVLQGLALASSPQLRVYHRASESSAPPPRRPPPRQDVASPAKTDERIDPVALHVQALTEIERGNNRHAEAILQRLGDPGSGYLPGMVEWALMCFRWGDRSAAKRLSRTVLELIEGMPPDTIVDGPEPLPAAFYQTSVRALLDRCTG